MTRSEGTSTNSACGSMNLRISQGQATRSTLTFSRVIHFMLALLSSLGLLEAPQSIATAPLMTMLSRQMLPRDAFAAEMHKACFVCDRLPEYVHPLRSAPPLVCALRLYR